MKKTLLFIITITIGLSSFSQTVWGALQNIDPNVGASAYVVASGDLDGDTDIDIIGGTYNFSADVLKWYQNDGTGSFTLQPTISTTNALQGIGGITIADLDGINGNDIIVGSFSNNSVIWYANDGTGNFSSEQIISNTVTGAGFVTTADVNQDGNLDVAAVGFTYDKVVWFPGNGDGTFGTEQTIANVDGPGNLSFADFDGDGDLDALVGFDNASNGTIEIYYNQYVESGTMTVSWIKDTVTVDSGNPFLFVAAFADINDDGTLEIVKSDNTSGEVAWYSKIKNGASTETIISDNTIIARPGVVKVVDLDNDTYNDVIVTDGGTADDALIWFESDDTGGLNMEATIADNNHQIFGITVGDFDGDGDKDIASIGFGSDTLDWYENLLETLSVENTDLETIEIYPNPTQNVLNFRGFTSETLQLQIFDILGKSVMNTSVNANGSLDISKLETGLYIIKFNDYDTTYKFVKE